MRLAIAGFSHESVTFLPYETAVELFENNATRGDELIRQNAGANTVICGFCDECARQNVAVEPLVATEVAPSGPVSEEAFERFAGEIIAGLVAAQDRIDGVLLSLHGAMATPTRQDPEAELLHGIRALLPDLPIALGMDLHGNISADMVQSADIVCGFWHSPHIDMADTGARAASLLIGKINGAIAPVSAIRKPGLTLPSIYTATAEAPLSDIMAKARALQAEHDAVADISIFTGFAYGDVKDIGFAVVVICDADRALAERIAEKLEQDILAQREQLYPRDSLLDAEQAVQKAQELVAAGRKPVVILEHADRMNDSTHVLGVLVERKVKRVAVPYLYDPFGVRAVLAAKEGRRLLIPVGGRSSERAGKPVIVAANVLYRGPKRYFSSGPYRRGELIDLGDTAVLDANGIFLILTSLNQSAVNIDPFVQFDLDVDEFDIILLRSKTHFRATYEDLAAEILIAETPDWGPADLATLDYRNARAGVFPIT